MKKYYPENMSATQLEEYKNYQIVKHRSKRNKMRSVSQYDSAWDKINTHLDDALEKINLICLGTRNNYERDLFSKQINKHRATDVYSLDISPESGADYILDFNSLPDRWENKWDAIFTNSIDHCIDPEKSLVSWMKTLKPSGVLLLMISRYDGEPTPSDCCVFDSGDISTMLKKISTMGEIIEVTDKKNCDITVIIKKNKEPEE